MYFANYCLKSLLKTTLTEFLKGIKNNDKKILKKIQVIFFNINFLYLLVSFLISLIINDFINILTHGKLIDSAKYIPFLFLSSQAAINLFITENYLILQNKVKFLSSISSLGSILFILSLPITLYYFQLWGAVLSYMSLRFFLFIFMQKQIKNYYFSRWNNNFYLIFFISLILLVILNLSYLNSFLTYTLAVMTLLSITFVFNNFIKSLKL
jgi:O-antigen/teichoic acid export membrane protein